MVESHAAYSFQIDEFFFTAIQAPQIQRGNVAVQVDVARSSHAFTLDFQIEGEVEVECDRCLEPMLQPIQTTETLCVKLGTTFAEDDDIITIPEEEGTIDLSWYIYEFIALSLPIYHAHEDGECNEEMMQALGKHWAVEAQGDEETPPQDAPTDPRWDALKQLIHNN